MIPSDITETRIVFKDEYFDLKGLSTYSKIGVSTLRHYISKNSLPCYKIPGKNGNSGKVLVKQSEFDEWIKTYWINRNRDISTLADEVIKKLETE